MDDHAALRVERDRLRQLIDSAPNVFYVVDEDTRVLLANQAASKFYGIPLDQLVGRRLTDVFGAARAEEMMGQTLQTMYADGPRFTPEELQLDAEGGEHYWELFETPIRDIETGRRAVLGVAQDVTTRREHARMTRDLEIAREIQRSLMPSEPLDIPGFDVAGWSEAADETGGDYFDWMGLPDGQTLFALADVTGHGLGPALVVAVCRAYLRAAMHGERVALPDAMARVNSLLHSDLIGGRFVTAAVALLDARRFEMALMSAGHGPMLFYHAATQQTELWNADALPFGISEEAEFDEQRLVHFEPGDTLLLVTDGFFEWANDDGEQFGTARLQEFLEINARLKPEALIDAMRKAVNTHAGAQPQADDLTALVIQRSVMQ